jgi:ubiquinone/menaquinone biosynthesis C-methylase UbiE
MSEQPINADAFRDFERAAHDEIAEGYRRFFTAVTDYAVEPLLDAAAVRAGRRVLDVATGPGLVAFRAAGRGAAAVTGVDLAPRMLELAAAQCPRVDFRQADAENLPLADQSFDCVVSNFGLGHFPRPERALSEFVRVLTPGGAVAVSWWDVPARHRVMGIFFDAMNEAGATLPAELPTGPPMFRFSDDQELSGALHSAGVAEVMVRTFSFVHPLASPEELWDGILGGTVRTSIGIRRQPKEVQDRIRTAYERLVQAYAGPDGVKVPVAFKIGSGRRPFA